jgi:TRAP-type C4-dicarboxylate transport system substrate-binding protein
MGLRCRSLATLTGLLVVSAFAVAGCSTPVEGPVVVLTLASPDTQDEPNGPAINQFVQQVARRSAGTMRVDVAWDVTPEGDYDWDQVVGRRVAAGEFDLALVPSRAWDVLGVTSLQALNTPFLIDSDESMRTVVASELRHDLLEGLSSAGVVGIDLWPSEMRRFFGIGEPLLSLTDFEGADIRTATSRAVTALLEAMGAEVVHTERGSPGQRGFESSFSITGVGAVATGNVVPFPKIETLVADDALRSRLQPGQWQVLLDAAAATRREQLESFPSDEELARDFCREGGEIVAATPSDLTAFEEVGREVRSELERDADTAALIEQLEALVATVPEPEPLTTCPRETSPTDSPEDGTTALDGIYVAHVARSDLVEAGVTEPAVIRNSTGHFTWTLDNGSWHHTQRARHYVSDGEQSGSYTYEDGRFTLHWGDEEVITARLDITRDGTIRFHDLRDNLPELQKATEGFFGQPWRRVGDLPG